MTTKMTPAMQVLCAEENVRNAEYRLANAEEGAAKEVAAYQLANARRALENAKAA
jgi:hypothetical protein